MPRHLRTVAVASTLALGVVSAVNASTHTTALTPAASESSTAFTYNGDTGPGFWGSLGVGNEQCAVGTSQSPVDIGRVKVNPRLRALKLDLEPTPIALVNNGYAIEMEIETPNTLTLGGVVYTSHQYHFHTLSEHAVRGQRGVMEMHAVFTNGAGKSAVVATLFQIGKRNRFIDELTAVGLPVHTGDHVTAAAEVDLARGLTDTAQYFTYSGSLTTPPCTEGVTWFVLKSPAQMSATQFERFRDILGNDFRPLQHLNGRTVTATAGAGIHH